MSNPEQKPANGSDDFVGDQVPQGTDISRGTGPAAPDDAETSRPAGVKAPQPVVASALSDARARAFELLRSTVATLEARGSSTFAAGVAARMLESDAAFSVRSLGFASFKAFVEVAAAHGFVRVARLPDTSDLTISTVPGPGRHTPAGPDGLRYLRKDLWRALTDRGGYGRYWWETAHGRLHGPASSPEEVGVSAEECVVVEPITSESLTEWMRTFASEGVDGDPLSDLLVALDAMHPIESFTEAVRAEPDTARRWGRIYRERVMTLAFEWSDRHGIPRAQILQPLGKPRAEARPAGAERPSPGARSQERDWQEYEAHVRAQVVGAVQRMPLTDLLRLPIPVEYLLRG